MEQEMTPSPGENERLSVSVTEAARILGISRTLAYQLVASGEIPSHQFMGRIVVPLELLRALLRDDAAD
jgi:excisionase family DNA binding protein